MHFQCRLDGESDSDFGACTSPAAFSELSPGSHTFDVRAVDGADNVGSSDSFTWTIESGHENVAPIAASFSIGAVADQDTTIDIFKDAGHASDPDGDTLTFGSLQNETDQGGAVADNEDGTVTYSPPSEFTGTDTFDYQVQDPTGLTSDVATVTVHVSATGEAVTIQLHWDNSSTSDLDLHTQLPGSFGELAYYSLHPQPWAAQDHDDFGPGPGDETHTITPDPGIGNNFHAGQYVVHVENYACTDSFDHTQATVTFTFADGSQHVVPLPSGSNLGEWSVGTMTVNANGTGSVSDTNTFSGSSCGPAPSQLSRAADDGAHRSDPATVTLHVRKSALTTYEPPHGRSGRRQEATPSDRPRNALGVARRGNDPGDDENRGR